MDTQTDKQCRIMLKIKEIIITIHSIYFLLMCNDKPSIFFIAMSLYRHFCEFYQFSDSNSGNCKQIQKKHRSHFLMVVNMYNIFYFKFRSISYSSFDSGQTFYFIFYQFWVNNSRKKREI